MKGITTHTHILCTILFILGFSGVMLLSPQKGHAAVTFVDETTSSVNGGSGNVDVSLPGSLVEGDIVIVAQTCDNEVFDIVTSGYTQLISYGSNDPGRNLAYKVMGATPDTIVTIDSDTLNSRDIAVAIQVWRGVDTSTPIDATMAESDRGGGSDAMPDPTSYTTVTDGALRIIVGFLDNDDVASSVTAPSGFSNLIAGDTGNVSDTEGATSMFASKVEATAGSLDPDAFGGDGADAWHAAHFALRPGEDSGPSAPTRLASTSTVGAVSLGWTAPASPGNSALESYGVWRSTSPFTDTADATLITSFATSTGTSYNDSSVSHGTIYYYGITATNGDPATSTLSNIKSSTPNSGRVIRLGGLL